MWTVVDQKNEAQFYGSFRALLDDGLIMTPHTEDEAEWQPSNPMSCSDCAPQQPNIQWTWEKDVQKPFEDLAETSKYERALKSRAPAFLAKFRIDGNNVLDFEVRINPDTLVHRALSLLAHDGDLKDIEASWRFITDDSTTPQVIGQYSLPNTSDFKSPEKLVPMKVGMELRPEQVKTVLWALSQERCPQTFEEEEFVESRAPKLSYRLVARARRKIIRCGGIIASDVGYGKTPVILALVHTQKAADKERAEQDEQKEQSGNKNIQSGFISSKATLVIVPVQLVDQWEDEAKAFWPQKPKPKIITIKNISSVRSQMIYDIQEADLIIIGGGACSGENYISDLAQVAGLVGPDKKASPRAKDSW